MIAYLFLLINALIGAPVSEVVTCQVSADTWIGMHRWASRADRLEPALEIHGAEEELVIRGRISFALLQFDLSPARGLTVDSAYLRFHRREATVPLHTLGLSTVSGSGIWREEESNFFQPESGRSWSYEGSDLLDVTFAQAGSLYAYERARSTGDGWWEVDVPPSIVHALLAGDQFGLMLCDEKGQTQTSHHLHSRESRYPPELVVEGTRRDRTPPGIVRSWKSGSGAVASSPEEARSLGRSGLQPGSIILDFGSAGDDAGEGVASKYELRYSSDPIDNSNYDRARQVERWRLDPLAPRTDLFTTRNQRRDRVNAVVEDLRPGEDYYFASVASDEAGNRGPVSSLGRYSAYHREFPSLPPPKRSGPPSDGRETTGGLRVWAIPDMVKVDPVTGNLLEGSEILDPRNGNSVWNASTSTVRLFGSRNEFVAFQLVVESDEAVSDVIVKTEAAPFQDSRLPEVFRSKGAIQIYREWFVPEKESGEASGEWYPDPLVPLSGPFNIPSRENPVPGQKVQPLFVDIYIPHSASAGEHLGRIVVETGGKRQVVEIVLEVLPLELPDELNFIVDLNCYGGVNSGWDLERGTPEYRSLEHEYHRMAHMHRTNLDVLGYSHDGSTTPDHAPPLEGSGAGTKVSSWVDWDAHFAPILDGSAFADLPRASVPVPAIYLPFFENWPGSVRSDYRFDNPAIPATQEEYQELITSHALEAEPIHLSFSQAYQDRYVAITRQFAEHIVENGWEKTLFTVYFNNKYYWKRPSQGGRGISWWLMDEPNHRDDILAASFLGYLTREGLKDHPEVPILFRTDISRIEWIRDLMPGQIDLNCISRRFFAKNRYLMNDRYRFGKQYWHYGSSSHPRESNIGMRAWCWRVYLSGGDGLLPWNAVRGAKAWDRAEPLTLFYPGNRLGVHQPFASMRLKAFRRGQQDVEYMILLANKLGWDREAVTRAVSSVLDLSSDVRMKSSEDAGQIRFQNLPNRALEDIRRRVSAALLE